MNRYSTFRKILLIGFLLAGTHHHLKAQSGGLDLLFDPQNGFQDAFSSGDVNTLAVQPDGKVIAAGQFLNYNGTERKSIARLHPDGNLDTTFKPGSGFANGANTGVVYAVALQPDGKIIAAGQFTQFNGEAYKCIVRLNSNGSVDKTFNPGTGFNDFRNSGNVLSLKLQPDGKILAGGNFIKFNDSARSGIVRLNSDGSLDQTFQPGRGFENTGTIKGQVSAMALQPDGSILAGGQFLTYNGSAVKSIVRIQSNGAIDAGFNAGAGLDNGFSHARVGAVALQPDGKILIGGYFNKVDATVLNGITRLNANGSIDPSFQPGKGFQVVDVFNDEDAGEVLALSLQPDGKILAGGAFTKVNGKDYNNIARLLPDGALDNNFIPGKGFLLAKAKVSSMALQPDGKIVTGGSFQTYNDTARVTMARLFAYLPALAILKFNPVPGYCAGTKVAIDFSTGTASFNSGNIFTAQLSDANGNFTNPVNIGTYAATGSGTLQATIPLSTTLGKAYRIRILSSAPSLTGADNGTDIDITGIPVVTANASSLHICAGDVLTLTGGGATTYTWNKQVQDGVAFSPAATETYTVTGHTGDCSASAQVTVAVSAYPLVSITTSADTVCANHPVTLTAKGATTYTWEPQVKDGVAFFPGQTNTYRLIGISDGCRDTTTITIAVKDTSLTTYIAKTECDSFALNGIFYKESGRYTQTLVNAAGCDSVFVLDLTINSVNAAVSQDGRILNATETGATYQWLDCDQENRPIIGANKQQFASNVDGSFSVIVTKSGCSDTSDCFTVKSTGIAASNLNSGISIYPNPVQHTVYINAPEETTVTVVGMDGRVLLQQSASQPVVINALNAGLYLFYIRDQEGRLLQVNKITKTDN